MDSGEGKSGRGEEARGGSRHETRIQASQAVPVCLSEDPGPQAVFFFLCAKGWKGGWDIQDGRCRRLVSHT